MKVVYTPAHFGHDPEYELEASRFGSPWEHPGRAEKIRRALDADGRFVFESPTQWGTAPIEAVHDPDLVRFLSTAWTDYQATNKPTRDIVPDVFYRAPLRDGMSPGREPTNINARFGWWCFETTTPVCEGTYEAARGAVDTALTAAQLVLDGERITYGLCRPPGHHAPRSLYGGYCFFNNAAVAAHHVAATTGTKVVVLDVDYHHGNGTQQIFYERDDVMYVSLHGDPARAYPYTVGYADETGAGRGLGANLNLPMPRRAPDDVFLDGLDTACSAIESFGPSMVVVSLGLDPFVTDPISDLAVTTEGFEACGRRVGALGLPTVVLQEGGYDVSALGENARRWLVGAAGW